MSLGCVSVTPFGQGLGRRTVVVVVVPVTSGGLVKDRVDVAGTTSVVRRPGSPRPTTLATLGDTPTEVNVGCVERESFTLVVEPQCHLPECPLEENERTGGIEDSN